MEWREVPGFPDYQVSDEGVVRSFRRYPAGRTLKESADDKGYFRVNLRTRDGGVATAFIHRLVLLAFVGPSELMTRHLDGDSEKNSLTNLAYGTQLENMADMLRHSRCHNANKTECSRGHTFTDANTYVHPSNGRRSCRTCSAASRRKWEANNVVTPRREPR